MPAHENSRKQALWRAFDSALGTLRTGEIAVVSLGSTSPNVWSSARTYWYDWKQVQRAGNPGWDWLRDISCRLQWKDGQQYMELVPRGMDLAPSVEAVNRVTGARRVIFAESGRSATMVQSSGEMSAEATQQAAWLNEHIAWAEANGRQVTNWPDCLFIALDPASPAVLALREVKPPQREDMVTAIEAQSNDPQFKIPCDWLRSIGIDPVPRPGGAGSGLMFAISQEVEKPRSLDSMLDALNTEVVNG